MISENLSRKELIFEQIKAEGYFEQNEILMQAGFKKLKQNLKYLRLCNGEVEQVLNILKEKRKKKTEPETREKGSSEDSDEAPVQPPNQNHRNKRPVKDSSLKLDSWPSNIRRVFFDGNNMLFVDNNIRNMRLQGKKGKAEESLRDFIIRFAQRVATFDTILVYDCTTMRCSTETVGTGGMERRIEVRSAQPYFKTSDDALVEWAGQIPKSELENCLFVTSDRGLKQRLTEKGVGHIMGSGDWFTIAKRCVNTDDEKSL